MQELSLLQMKMVSGGVDIPKVQIEGNSAGASFGSAATAVGAGSYSSPGIGNGGGSIAKAVEVVVTIVNNIVNTAISGDQPPPALEDKERIPLSTPRSEAALDAAVDAMLARNHKNSSK